MDVPPTKREPGDARIPQAQREPNGDRDMRAPRSSPKIKQEPLEDFQASLPYRPLNSAITHPARNENGSSPPNGLPVGPLPAHNPSDMDIDSATSRRNAVRRLWAGPMPQERPPQGRSRQAAPGMNEGKNSQKSRDSPLTPFRGSFYKPRGSGTPLPADKYRPAPSAAGPPDKQDSSEDGVAATIPDCPPTTRLSRACQRRGFNPGWVIDELPDNTFTCDVRLLDQVVKHDQAFPTLQDAKCAIAAKALEVLPALPMAYAPRAPSQLTNAPLYGQRAQAVLEHGEIMMEDLPRRHGATTSLARIDGRSHDDARSHEEASLLDYVSRVMAIPVPESSRDNPEATRAFLEGLAVGARLASTRPAPRFRGRSRSPPARRPQSEFYRPRSPLPERARMGPSRGYFHHPPEASHRPERFTPPPRPHMSPRTTHMDLFEPRAPAPGPGPSGGSNGMWVHDRFWAYNRD